MNLGEITSRSSMPWELPTMVRDCPAGDLHREVWLHHEMLDEECTRKVRKCRPGPMSGYGPGRGARQDSPMS